MEVKKLRIMLSIGLLSTLLVHCNQESDSSQNKEAEGIIKMKLNQWVKDFENKNMGGVKSIFSKELIGSYQGSNEQTYNDIEGSYWFGNDTISPTYHLEIEEIRAEQNMAYVRDTWAYVEKNLNSNSIDTLLKIRSHEIWSLESDKEWRITRWISYPIQDRASIQ
ncbi:MAG: hypothetical protein Tsb0034_09800 [Ekhidna sp.]